MFQIYADIPWSYAVGAGLALAGAHQLRGSQAPSQRAEDPAGRSSAGKTGRFLLGTLLYTALIFVPGSMLVLWLQPEWATMQRSDGLSTGTAAAMAGAQVALAGLGCLITAALLVRGKIRWAAFQMLTGYFAMAVVLIYGWDGSGWQRFLAADRADHARRPDLASVSDLRPWFERALDWAFSDVAWTLYLSGAVVIGGLILIMGGLHQLGLALAGVPGPGLILTGILAAFSVGGAFAAAAAAALLVHWIGWIGPVIGLPLVWLVVLAKGALITIVTEWLGLPSERSEEEAVGPSYAN